ncbi:hypothetical protein IV203_009267 [Nitzschia inconspicua]|uniref:Uncharacterized protein n=1 Tax=Nitzschia inconspicua TaxID=303405 RepID=A0A9K3PMX9_9STRA|nr:hypothetical protein IV203_009267 [Nitzschia inconspicua]
MWSNHSSKTGGRRAYRKAANIKGYLGGFGTSSEQLEPDDAISCGDMSSLGGLSALDTASTATADFRSSSSSKSSLPTERSSRHHHPQHPSILVEIPENFPRELDDSDHNCNGPFKRGSLSPPPVDDDLQDEESVSIINQKITEMKRRWNERAQGKDDSSAIVEIQRNLDDIDNYLLSIYMNDDASIYTKATTDSSFSSASSVSSSFSTRQRHRGAYKSRRGVSRHAQQQQQGSWLESMRESASSVFVEGEGGWTPLRGWSIDPKKTWDPQPDDRWKDDSLNVFETVSKERLEI